MSCWHCRTFIQFVCTLWSFFTLKPEEIGSFVFFIFDLEKAGHLPFSDVTHVVKQLHRKHFAESPALQALVAKMVKGPAARGGKQPLTAEAFQAWSGANAEVCRPMAGKQVYIVQQAVRCA
jgi:hypothetical protein